MYYVRMNPFVDKDGKLIPPAPVGTPRPDKRPFSTGTSYFFKKSDGYFISVDAKNAWNILSGKNQIIGKQKEPWEYVGRSSGQHYIDAANELRKNFNTMKIDDFKAGLEKALVEEYEIAKKDPTLPPNYDVIDRNGMPIRDLSNYGQN